MRRAIIVALLAVPLALVIAASGTALAVVEPEPVITGKGAQYRGFANDSYVAYSNWTRSTGTVAFAKSLADGTRTKLNAAGTEGNVGGFDPGTNAVIYQQWTRRGSGIFFYDLDTDVRTQAPGVNSRYWEWNPLISNTFIVYSLDRYRRGNWYTSLKVYHRADQVARTLGTWKWDPNMMFPGSAGDQYITYTLCTRITCFAYLYDWQNETRQRIPTVGDQAQYAPVVDEANSVVYFTRSAPEACGRAVDVWRRPIPLADTDTPVKIVDLPRGIDTGWESSLTANGDTGNKDLYFERWNCSQEVGDVYVARGVDLVT